MISTAYLFDKDVVEEKLIHQIGGAIIDEFTFKKLRTALDATNMTKDPKSSIRVVDEFGKSIVAEIKQSGIKNLDKDAVDSWIAHQGRYAQHIVYLLDPNIRKEILDAAKRGEIANLNVGKQLNQSFTGSISRKVFANIKTTNDLIKLVNESISFAKRVITTVAKYKGGNVNRVVGNHYYVINGLVALKNIITSVLRRAK